MPVNKPKNTKPQSSTLSRMMAKGQAKTRYKPSSGKLLMQLSENDHKRIALLISKWLKSDDRK
ncbi:MAG: hypothetical protein CL600_08620 [Alteromonas sp.]|jgi:hypothetical protein|nr:hypothetical protein CW735_10270 [Alteromonas sp. MB-3u-76]MAI64921.1 hypothetical protein [Alteromonas sp.]